MNSIQGEAQHNYFKSAHDSSITHKNTLFLEMFLNLPLNTIDENNIVEELSDLYYDADEGISKCKQLLKIQTNNFNFWVRHYIYHVIFFFYLFIILYLVEICRDL